jgi:drug/metabolite transporter (DMT)-like permease
LDSESETEDENRAENEEEKIIEKSPRKNIGLLYMFLGSLSMSFMNVTAKLINQSTDITVLEVCYFRGLIMAIGCTLHSYASGFSVIDIKDSTLAKWVFWRSFLGFLSFSFQFIALYLMPLSIAMVLYFTQPISTSVVSYFMAGEKLACLDTISIFSAMLGVVVLAQPQILIPGIETRDDSAGYPYYYLGVFFSLSGSVISGFAYYTMR